uniref:Uncharacterized protein n=1 Tax=Moniliophthora roreri TaxID=221103 RepID=A0A0W0GEL6_MONRR
MDLSVRIPRAIIQRVKWGEQTGHDISAVDPQLLIPVVSRDFVSLSLYLNADPSLDNLSRT